MCSHEETKRHFEAAVLVNTQKRGGDVSHRDLHRSPDPSEGLLQLLEMVSATRTGRIEAAIQEVPSSSKLYPISYV